MSAHLKNNCVIQFVFLSILDLTILIIICFSFDAFWILDFFSISSLEFYLI
jgi:hypothetical protein